MDTVKNKMNIFFTTSYVIILGFAVPTLECSSIASYCVEPCSLQKKEVANESHRLDESAQLLSCETKGNDSSNSGTLELNSLPKSEISQEHQSKTIVRNFIKQRKSEHLQFLAYIQLLI